MVKVLKTKRDWIAYAMELETALCLRPFPGDAEEMEKYPEWWSSVVDLWEAYDTSNASKELG